MFRSGGGSRRALIWRGYGRRHGWRRQKGTNGSGQERIQIAIWNTKERVTVAVNTIRADPNAPLYYALGSEHYHLIISKLGGHGGQLCIYIDMFCHKYCHQLC